MKKLLLSSVVRDESHEHILQCKIKSSKFTDAFSERQITGIHYDKKSVKIIVDDGRAFVISSSNSGILCEIIELFDSAIDLFFDTSELPSEFLVEHVGVNLETIVNKDSLKDRIGHTILRIIHNPSQLLLYVSGFAILCFNCFSINSGGTIVIWHEEVETYNRSPSDLDYIQKLNRRIEKKKE
ncbi:MAG: hypothetical protein AAGC44_13620 [Planctomycetota bacterium]